MTTNKGIITLLLAVFLSTSYISHHAIAQTGQIDSIRKVLEQYEKDDTTKVHLLQKLAIAYNNNNNDSVCILGEQALILSQQLSYSKGVASATEILASGYQLKGNRDSAIYYTERAIEQAQQGDYPVLLGTAYNDYGNIYLRSNDYGKAMSYYDTAIIYGEETGNASLIAKASSNRASILYRYGNYSEALKSYIISLNNHLKNNDREDVESSLLNISNVYYQLEDYNKAISYLDSCSSYTQGNATASSKISISTTYSMIYDKQGKHDSALIYQMQGLEVAKALNSVFLTNLVNQNVAECYLNLNELDKSLQLYRESVGVSEKLEDVEGLAVAQAGIGEVLVKQGKLSQAAMHLQKGLNGMVALGLREGAMETAKTLYQVYAKQKNYKKALECYQKYSLYSDTLNSNKEKLKVRQMDFNNELEVKQSSIDRLQKEQIIEQQKHDQRKILLLAAFIGFLLTAVIAYLIFRNLKVVQKSKQLIEEQKKEIEQKTKHLTELNSFKDMTFSVLSHDLRSPINSLNSTMMLLDEELITLEEFSVHKKELNTKLHSVTLILDNLLLWARDQMKGANTLRITELDITARVKECAQVLKDPATQKNIIIDNRVPESVIAYGDKNQVLMVIRNILSNAVKFTPTNGTVTINATTDDKYTTISITDTGMGMPSEKVKHLFDGDANFSTMGTSGEKGTGIGLMLAYRFIKQNGGEIIVNSEQGKGTTFYVQLPITDTTA